MAPQPPPLIPAPKGNLDTIRPTDTLAKSALSQHPYPFNNDTFYACWWQHLAPKFPIIGRQNDCLVVQNRMFRNLLPFKEAHIAGWNWCWGHELTHERLADIETLRKELGWDIFRMEWKRFRLPHQAFEALEAAGVSYTHLTTVEHPEYLIDLGQGFEGFLKGLNAKSRYNLRQKMKRAKSYEPHLVEFTGPHAVDEFFALFFPAHIKHWDSKGGGSYLNDPREQAFIRAWAQTLHEQGDLLLQGLQLNGAWAHLTMSITTGDTLYWPLVITTDAYPEAFPGLISLFMQIEKAANAGFTIFNMGKGDDLYKRQFSTIRSPNYQLIISNPDSIRGRLYAARLKQKFTGVSTEALPEISDSS